MTRAGIVLAAVFVSLASFLSVAGPARADATIVSATIDNGYPKQITFKVTAQAAVDITDVTLSYAITGRGTSALGKPADFAAGKNVSASVAVQVNSGSSYIPVGSEFLYHWEIATSDGKTTVGPDTKFLFLPPNQDWKNVSGSFMTVYYHGDKANLANQYLQAGVETYDKIGKKLLNTELKLTPVKVILFDDEKESDPARPGTGGAFDAAVTTCGTKVSQDIVLVIPVSCGSSDRTDTLRHEFGHILNQTAGEGPFGKLPSWLDEGTAVYAQTTPGTGYSGAFDSAARASRLIPFAQMGSAPSVASQVDVFYGEAYAMVKYLIDKGGPAKYAQFFATIKGGSRFDQALQQLYGFDMTGFEKEFLASVGSQPRPSTPVPTPRPQQASPTAAPTKAPTKAPASTSSSNGDGVDRTSLVIVAGAVLLFLLGVLAFLLANMFANNRRRAAPAPAAPPPFAPPPAEAPPEIPSDTEEPPPGNDGMV